MPLAARGSRSKGQQQRQQAFEPLILNNQPAPLEHNPPFNPKLIPVLFHFR